MRYRPSASTALILPLGLPATRRAARATGDSGRSERAGDPATTAWYRPSTTDRDQKIDRIAGDCGEKRARDQAVARRKEHQTQAMSYG